MLPTVDEALYELKLAEGLNPGPWVRHSVNTGVAARNIAEKVSWLNPEKAYIVGLLHDIGRRVGVVDIPTHVYEGYQYCMEKGWDEAARICMTHSYLRMRDEFDYDPEKENEKAIKEYILNCRADDYDKLIQLCDSLAVDYGFVILEKRFVDVTRRYGIMEGYIKGWEIAFSIKEYFEKEMGCSIYDVLPDVGKTSLLTPKPWKPGNPSAFLAFSRGILGGLFLLAFLKLKRRKQAEKLPVQTVLWLAVSGAVMGVNWILLFEAYNYTTVAVATLCYYMQPTIVVLLSPVLFKERLTLRKGACAAVAVIGMVLVSGVIGGGAGVRCDRRRRPAGGRSAGHSVRPGRRGLLCRGRDHE